MAIEKQINHVNPFQAPTEHKAISSEHAQSLQRIPFSPEDEVVMCNAGQWMKFTGIANLIFSGAMAVQMIQKKSWGIFIIVITVFLMGVWTFAAGRAFQKVASSDHADQHFLMMGFTQLRRTFLVKAIWISILLLAVIFVLVKLFLVVSRLGQ